MIIVTTEIQSNEHTFTSPAIVTRLKSILIDNILLFGCLILLSTVLSKYIELPTTLRVVAVSMALLYEPVLVSFHRTLGQKLTNIRVIDHTAYMHGEVKPIGIFRSLIRYLAKYMLGWVSLLAISFSKDRRAIHDFVSGSIMIEE